MVQSNDPAQISYFVFSLLAPILTLIPLPWHIQAWNAGTCAFMIWTAVSCLIRFVNAIVWTGNTFNVAPIWCDISSKIMIGGSVGIPASLLSISRRLYCITIAQTTTIGCEAKRRNVIIDLCIALGIPAAIMILHITVQGHRFNILEDVGCYPVVYNTMPAYFLYFMWPVLLGVLSFVYSGLAIRSSWRHRIEFNQISSSHSTMTVSRCFRLMLLALLGVLLTVPLWVYTIYLSNYGVGLVPWISRANAHYNFGRVVQVPTLIWHSDPKLYIAVELTRWLPVLCAIVFICLFGFAEEARKHYRAAFWVVFRRLGVQPTPRKVPLPRWNKLNKKTSAFGSFLAYSQKTPVQEKRRMSASSEVRTLTGIHLENDSKISTPTLASPNDRHGFSSQYALTAVDTLPLPQGRVDSKPSYSSMRSYDVRDRFFLTGTSTVVPDSPAPFTNIVPPTSPTSAYMQTGAQPSAQNTDVIQIMVHQESHSTDSL